MLAVCERSLQLLLVGESSHRSEGAAACPPPLAATSDCNDSQIAKSERSRRCHDAWRPAASIVSNLRTNASQAFIAARFSGM